MILQEIEIHNFRSIDSVRVKLKRVKNTSTYCLFGINESGKSSFLQALSLYDSKEIRYPQDYFQENKPVSITMHYKPESTDHEILHDELQDKFEFPDELVRQIVFSKVVITVSYSADSASTRNVKQSIEFSKTIFEGYELKENKIVKLPRKNAGSIDIELLVERKLGDHFWSNSHRVVFWKAAGNYLMQDEVDLNAFKLDPAKISIPLFNSFGLSGIGAEDIVKEVDKLINPAAIRNLESLLSEEVTSHIQRVWSDHPIVIRFEINNNKITMLVEDKGVKHKSKSTSQRSDGFRQFISFLLSVSAENTNDELVNVLMLIDEPETHLHPKAQLHLMKELIKITATNNNVVFYATHSNFMIDKSCLERNIKVLKKKNEKTIIEYVSEQKSTYSEVNYAIFNIPTTDYHNELYVSVR